MATWVEWIYDGQARSELCISAWVRTLLPRGGISRGVGKYVRGVTRSALVDWLTSHGYEVLSLIDGPDTHEMVKGW